MIVSWLMSICLGTNSVRQNPWQRHVHESFGVKHFQIMACFFFSGSKYTDICPLHWIGGTWKSENLTSLCSRFGANQAAEVPSERIPILETYSLKHAPWTKEASISQESFWEFHIQCFIRDDMPPVHQKFRHESLHHPDSVWSRFKRAPFLFATVSLHVSPLKSNATVNIGVLANPFNAAQSLATGSILKTCAAPAVRRFTSDLKISKARSDVCWRQVTLMLKVFCYSRKLKTQAVMKIDSLLYHQNPSFAANHPRDTQGPLVFLDTHSWRTVRWV